MTSKRRYFSRIELSAKNLANLIEDILEVSRIEQGKLDFTPSKIQPEEVIKELVEELKPKAEEKNLKLIFKPKRE